MGAIWLRDLAAVYRASNPLGVPVLEVPGWQTRSRSTGGYDAIKAFVVHHTAEGVASDGWPSANFQCFHDDARPNAPIYLSREPALYIMAAGACNTQGAGSYPSLGIGDGMGNREAFGFEIGNRGTGEAYSTRQQAAIKWVIQRWFEVYGARFGLKPSTATIAHFEYAPNRKCDPTGPSRWTPPNSLGCEGAPRWSMPALRADLAIEPTPPPAEVTDVIGLFTVQEHAPEKPTFATDGLHHWWVSNQAARLMYLGPFKATELGNLPMDTARRIAGAPVAGSRGIEAWPPFPGKVTPTPQQLLDVSAGVPAKTEAALADNITAAANAVNAHTTKTVGAIKIGGTWNVDGTLDVTPAPPA